MLNSYNVNKFSSPDKKFVKTVKLFLLESKTKYSMMEIVSKTGLSKTQVSLSLDKLISEKQIECIYGPKKYYIGLQTITTNKK